MNQMSPQQRAWFDALIEDRQATHQALQKPSMRNMWRTIEGMYSEQAHFVYELLQNADDVQATNVRFILNKQGLIFAHNGKVHFSVSDPHREDIDRGTGQLGHLNAITSIGQSSKSDEGISDSTSPQIGKFGIGFKSVFQYTTSPHIYDPPFCFSLKSYIVPSDLGRDFAERKKDETLFWFPFNREDISPTESYQQIKNRLEQLGFPSLFLRHVFRISYRDLHSGEQGHYFKHINSSKEAHGIRVDDCSFNRSINGEKEKRRFHILSRNTKERNIPYSVAFMLDEKKRIKADERPPAYCFFPTKVLPNFPFIVHAPFLLTDNREGIKEKVDWNEYLLDELAKLLADGLLILKDQKLLDTQAFLSLPFDTESLPDYRFHRFRHKLIQKLKSGPALLPTLEGGHSTPPSAALAESKGLMEQFPSDDIKALFDEGNRTWVLPGVNRQMVAKMLKEDLLVPKLSTELILEHITQEFMEAKSDDWLRGFYLFLERQTKTLGDDLRICPIIRTSTGEFTALFEKYDYNSRRFFHAEDRKPDYRPKKEKKLVYAPYADGTESTFPTIDPELWQDEELKPFFEWMGIQQPNLQDELSQIILPLYTSAKGPDSTESYQKHLRQMQRFQEGRSYDTLNIGEHYIVPAYNPNDPSKEIQWLKPSNPNLLIESDLVRKYLSLFDVQPPILFVCQQFLEELFQTHYPVRSFLDLFEDLGVKHIPGLIYTQNYDEDVVNQHIQRFNLPDKRSTERRSINEFDLPGITEESLINITLDGSVVVWDFLIELFKSSDHEHPFGKGYLRWFYYNAHYEYFDASFVRLLKESYWLYDKVGTLLAPYDLSSDQLHPAYNRDDQLTEQLAALIDLGGKERAANSWTNHVPDEKKELANAVDKLAKLGLSPDEIEKLGEKEAQKKSLSKSLDAQTPTPNTNSSPDEESIYAAFPDAFFRPPTPVTQHDAESEDIPADSQLSLDDDQLNDKLSSKRAQLEKEYEAFKQDLEQKQAITEELKNLARYSFGWFTKLLELEYLHSYESQLNDKAITLNFHQVQADPATPRTLTLSDPSRFLPPRLEDLNDLTLTLHTREQNHKVSVEVFSVKDREIKAKLKPNVELDSNILSDVFRASLRVQNPGFVLEVLKEKFHELPFADHDCLKAALPENLSFIFGPPGTGKTFQLAQRLRRQYAEQQQFTLVLTPTNKAADVLARQIIEQCGAESPAWLYRFGNTDDPDVEQGYFIEKETDFLALSGGVVITTIARFPYDGFSSGRGEDEKLRNIPWDQVIFDEGSMIFLPSILHAIYQTRENNLSCEWVIAGDPFQIEPVVILDEWREENIYQMIGLHSFENPQTEPHPFAITNLTRQYRSIPPIGELFSRYTYGGRLEHDRSLDQQRTLTGLPFELKPLSLIGFPVKKEDSVYKPQRLQGRSSYHPYTAIFAAELARFLARHATAMEPSTGENWSIGIICPYAAQAAIIDKLIGSAGPLPTGASIQCGTVHGFQGDACNLIIALFNPPPSISSNKRMFLNKQNIINVAISRARDYLILCAPDSQTEGIQHLHQLRQMMGPLNEELRPQTTFFHASQIEKKIFGRADYIHDSTFTTSHQNVNVYGLPEHHYEVRMEENAIDIQIKPNP